MLRFYIQAFTHVAIDVAYLVSLLVFQKIDNDEKYMQAPHCMNTFVLHKKDVNPHLLIFITD